MYLTMNRFKVKPDAGSQAAFEEIWLSRESKLTQVPGFVEFHMPRGPESDGYRLYVSHTMWEWKRHSRPGPDQTRFAARMPERAGAGRPRTARPKRPAPAPAN